jgi:hypothetical protein
VARYDVPSECGSLVRNQSTTPPSGVASQTKITLAAVDQARASLLASVADPGRP